ncbi:MAG TPA: hypothetical protein PLG67_13565, partial [Bacillota bacterium]|nr:hypothetical protein [Bacillota bacterium]
ASMPASRTFYQSHIRGLLPKCIKVCPAILYKLLLGYASSYRAIALYIVRVGIQGQCSWSIAAI